MAAGARELVWCDLTGGYDTRILALLARSAGLSFITSTNGRGDEEDVRLARQIADEAGWEWSLLSLPESWDEMLTERMPEAIAWGDGALDSVQLAGVLWRHETKAKRATALLNGAAESTTGATPGSTSTDDPGAPVAPISTRGCGSGWCGPSRLECLREIPGRRSSRTCAHVWGR